MALNSIRIWLIVCLVTIFFALHACSTTPSSPQPPVRPQPPTNSSQTTSDSTSKAPKSSEGKTQEAASKANSVEPDTRNTAKKDADKENQGTSNAERADHHTDESTVPISPTLPAALPTTKTGEERTLELDQKLNKSLSTFDGKLLKERQILEEQGTFTGSGGAQGDAPTTGNLGSGNEEGSIPRDIPPGSPSSGEKPQAASPGGSSASQRGGRPPTPPDIPDSHDDDIIARQLREAAENETDPALREKLWEEYRKYKKGGSS